MHLILLLAMVVADGDDKHNTLTAAEQEAGWILLFDGKTLDAWRGYKMDEVGAGWRVDGDALHFSPPSEGESGMRSDLVSREQFGDFELSLDWRIEQGGNSGVMYRVTEDAEKTYHTGPEIQILDDDAHRDGGNPKTSCGANYALHAPSKPMARPVGDWNSLRIRVEGDRVQHWLNGEQVVDYRLWDDEWKALVADSKFAQWPGYGMSKRGHVVLQDHGNPVWFRNLRIRRLD
ncbi:MAG TPA: DUF1080 domain-containing protein [Thermoanaerobaculia bacterium]|nr:DUF1080 domain-containing protein [Thermoanaerobaculia bacterium]